MPYARRWARFALPTLQLLRQRALDRLPVEPARELEGLILGDAVGTDAEHGVGRERDCDRAGADRLVGHERAQDGKAVDLRPAHASAEGLVLRVLHELVPHEKKTRAIAPLTIAAESLALPRS